MVFTIAKATGWTEDFIIWMPLRRALQYMHAAWVSDGLSTAWRTDCEEAARDAGRLYERLRYLTR